VPGAPYFNSGGFQREQGNAIGVYLVDTNGAPYTAIPGGGGTSDVNIYADDGGTPVAIPGTVARGILVDASGMRLADAVASPGTERILHIVGGSDGTNYRAIKTSSAGILQTDVLSAPTTPVNGTVAHDAADSGNPVKLGTRARSSDVGAVTENDRADLLSTLLGKLLTQPYALPTNLTKGSANSTGTGDTSVIAAPGAGLRLYITSLVITNAHATVGTKVQLKSGATTTGYPRFYAAAAGGGWGGTLPAPLRLGVNEALQFANVTTGADVDVSAIGYVAGE
jgi:hypothetical protein